MRLPRLLLGCLAGLGALPLACGDDSSVSAGGAPAGEADQAGASNDAGGAGTVAGSRSGAGESSGGTTETGGAGQGGSAQSGAAGHEPGDACLPRASVPHPVVTTLKVQSSCTAVAACAAELEHSEWAYSEVCLDQHSIFQPVYDECPSSQLNGPADIVVSGTLKLADGVATHAATISATGVFQIPNACHACDCKGQQEILKNNGAGPNTFCYEDCYPDLSCRCLIDFEIEVSEQEAYEVSDGKLTLEGGKQYDVCAASSSLALAEVGSEKTLPGTATLIPAAATVTPEICDGVDNDKNGEVDDQPQDCPAEPCISEGVCADVTPTCNGHWTCDYSGVGRELGDETLCDGLDNDCDGEVDEKLVGCFEKCDGLDNDNDGTVDDDPQDSPCTAKLGVCATGSGETCLGAEGWRCDFPASYEGGETSCDDGKDNDCDGQVDEGCSCPLGKSQMFVAHWGNTPELIRADLDGKNPQLVTALSGFALSKIAIDTKANKLYFSDASDKIQRADLDGGNIEVIWTGKSQTWHFEPSLGLIGECNTSGICRLNPPSTTTTLVAPAAVAGSGIDPVNRYIYWSDHGSSYPNTILRAGLDGSNVTGITKKGAFAPLALEVDPVGQKIYWPDANGIHEVGLDGSNEKLLLPLPSSYTYDMAIDAIGSKMYFTDVNANEARRVNLDGSGYAPLLTQLTYPVSIALYVCP